MARARDLGLHEQAFILAGVGPLRSDKGAEFMRNKVPGVIIPDDIVARLRQTPKERKAEEGKKICIEIIQQLREIEGVAGVHVMAYRQEELVAEIIREAGLLPRSRLKGQSLLRRPDGELEMLQQRATVAK
jgi:methylenetetrahydrofolate reductase (NADPH)